MAAGRPKKWAVDDHDAKLIAALKNARRQAEAEIKRLKIERDNLSDAVIAKKFDLPVWVIKKHF